MSNEIRYALLGVIIGIGLSHLYNRCNNCSLVEIDENDSGSTNLLPIFNPVFNLREACKHLILLEDHLINVRKRCKDCIRKHLLTIEAFLEEGKTLDKKGTLGTLFEKTLQEVRTAGIDFTAGDDPMVIAQGLRDIRKSLVPKCFDILQ